MSLSLLLPPPPPREYQALASKHIWHWQCVLRGNIIQIKLLIGSEELTMHQTVTREENIKRQRKHKSRNKILEGKGLVCIFYRQEKLMVTHQLAIRP